MFFVFILQDLDFTTVKDMVKFIYSGRLLDIADKSDLLLSAADKYDIKDLKEICCQCLSANLNVDQVNLGCCFYIFVSNLIFQDCGHLGLVGSAQGNGSEEHGHSVSALPQGGSLCTA